MLLGEEQKDRIALVADEIQKAGDKIAEFQQKVKAAKQSSQDSKK
jgi:hypothetical protein